MYGVGEDTEFDVVNKLSHNHTIIPQISVRLPVCPSVRLSVCPSVRLSVCPSISTETVRTMPFELGQCVARNPTMCLLFLSLYGCGEVIQLNDFVWCSLAFIANVVVGFPRRCRKKKLPAINHARGLPFNPKLHRLSKTLH